MTADQIRVLWNSVDQKNKRDIVSYRLKVEFDNDVLDILNQRRGGTAPAEINADPQSNEPFIKDNDVKARQTELFTSFKGNVPEA